MVTVTRFKVTVFASCAVASSQSLMPQRVDRIDARGPAAGDQSRQCRDQHQGQRGARVDRRIGGFQAEELRLDQAAKRQRRGQSDGQAEDHQRADVSGKLLYLKSRATPTISRGSLRLLAPKHQAAAELVALTVACDVEIGARWLYDRARGSAQRAKIAGIQGESSPDGSGLRARHNLRYFRTGDTARSGLCSMRPIISLMRFMNAFRSVSILDRKSVVKGKSDEL